MKIRISRQRREFGYEGVNLMDREAGESNLEIKVAKTGYFTKKKVLEIGLQAANKIKVPLSNLNMRYRTFHLKPTSTVRSMPSCNTTRMTSWARCRNTPSKTRPSLRSSISSLTELRTELRKRFSRMN